MSHEPPDWNDLPIDDRDQRRCRSCNLWHDNDDMDAAGKCPKCSGPLRIRCRECREDKNANDIDPVTSMCFGCLDTA